jgi:hypothetical protein
VAPSSRRRALLFVALLLVAEVIFNVLDVVLGPWARMHWEELFNARAAVQLACGHWDAAPRLQYRNFCGGCSAEAAAAAPLLAWAGATVLPWKVLPAAVHLGIVSTGSALAWRAAGPRAGVAFAALMIGAPGFYRELTHTAWGNHVESTLFPFTAALLLVGATHTRWSRPLLLLLAGVVTGAGLWFCQTSAWAVPVLAIGAWLAGRWLAPLVAVGVPIGFSPWWWFFEQRPHAADETVAWWANVKPAPPGALVEHLFGEVLRDGLWAVGDYGESGAGPTLWWFLLWALAVAGLIGVARRGRKAGIAGLLAPVGLATYLSVLALRWDWWEWLPDVFVNDAFNLRYRAPLIPLLALGAALLAGRSRRHSPVLVLVGLLSIYGLGRRALTWTGGRGEPATLRVYQPAGWPDRSVPTGEPRQQLARKQGRPQDLEAAFSFVESHQDPIADCRWDHLFEVGRRSGLARDQDAQVARVLPLLADDWGGRRRWADGYAQALIGEDGSHDPVTLAGELDAVEARAVGLGDVLGAAAGRRAAGAWRPEQDATHLPPLDPRVRAGVCEARGLARMDGLTGHGERPPPALEFQPDVGNEAGQCAGTQGFVRGLGVGVARFIGCDPGDRPDDPTAQLGWEEGCRLYR